MPVKRLTNKQIDNVWNIYRYEEAQNVVEELNIYFAELYGYSIPSDREYQMSYLPIKKPKRKLSAWQKFVKTNSKKPRFRYKSGSKKGRINLKALGVAYRKKRR